MERLGALTLRQLARLAASAPLRWLRVPRERATKRVALRDWARRAACVEGKCARAAPDRRAAEAACVCRADGWSEAQARRAQRHLARAVRDCANERRAARASAGRAAHATRKRHDEARAAEQRARRAERWRAVAGAVEYLGGAELDIELVTHVGDAPVAPGGPRRAVPERRGAPVRAWALWRACTAFGGGERLPDALCGALEVELERALLVERLVLPADVDDLRNEAVYRLAARRETAPHAVRRLRLCCDPQTARLRCVQPWVLEARVAAEATIRRARRAKSDECLSARAVPAELRALVAAYAAAG